MLIPSESLDRILKSLQSTFNELEKTSRFQIFHGETDSFEVLLYQSGMLVFDPQLEEKVNEILDQNSLPHKSAGKFAISKKKGRGNKSSMWLSDLQINDFLHRLKEDSSYISQKLSNELKITNNQTKHEISISRNNIVTFYENQSFTSILYEVIQDHIHFQNTPSIFGIASTGLKSEYGPIIISLCILNQNQAIEAQKLGFRHTKASRSKSLNKVSEFLETFSVPHKLIFYSPNQLNEEPKISNFTVKLQNEISNFIAKSMSILFLSQNEPLLSYLDDDISYAINDQYSESSFANILCANLVSIAFDNWKREIEGKLGYYISPKLSIENEMERNLVFHQYLANNTR